MPKMLISLLSLVNLLFLCIGIAAAQAGNAQESYMKLLGSANLEHRQGNHELAIELGRQACAQARESVGASHGHTLLCQQNLATFYNAAGKAQEAEPLLIELLRVPIDNRDEDAKELRLSAQFALAHINRANGHYKVAEERYRNAADGACSSYGATDRRCLTATSSLAGLLADAGKFGQAQSILERTLNLEAQSGDRFSSWGMRYELATVYLNQGQFEKAQTLIEEALRRSESHVGRFFHPANLQGLFMRARIFMGQGDLSNAAETYRALLPLAHKFLGSNHQNTLTAEDSLGYLESLLGRHQPAIDRLTRVVDQLMKASANDLPPLARSLNNLALAYWRKGDTAASEKYFLDALTVLRAGVGDKHPTTFTTLRNLAELHIDRKQYAAAVALLSPMAGDVRAWVAEELVTTRGTTVRRTTASGNKSFQNLAISLASLHPSPESRALAANAILGWKQMLGETDSRLEQFVRLSSDPKVQALGQEVLDLRKHFAYLWHKGEIEASSRVLGALEAKELQLRTLSQAFAELTTLQNVTWQDVAKSLPRDAALLEFRQFEPAGTTDEPRWAALVLKPEGIVNVHVLSRVQDTAEVVRRLLRNWQSSGSNVAEASAAFRSDAAKLYSNLIAPLAKSIAGVQRLYIAGDGILHMVPFEALVLPNGHFWIEAETELRMVQTGRDLLPRAATSHSPARGLLALGGVDYNSAQQGSGSRSDSLKSAAGTSGRVHDYRTASAFKAFRFLKSSREEAIEIGRLYKQSRNEPVQVWTDGDAQEERLKALTEVPRTVHFATHGFYRAPQSAAEEPMVLSGLALAGANRSLTADARGNVEDGILYAVEAAGLNFHGTKLVVLSACETGQGTIDYSDGVYSLARGFQIAGASAVLMTLTPISDSATLSFMGDFYGEYLERHADPAAALRAVKRRYVASDAKANPLVWSAFVLVERR